jgi:hypothetical protein
MKTIVSLDRVRAIAKGYILPQPYNPNPERTLRYCYTSIIGDYRISLEYDPERGCYVFSAEDELLEQLVDEYFNL